MILSKAGPPALVVITATIPLDAATVVATAIAMDIIIASLTIGTEPIVIPNTIIEAIGAIDLDHLLTTTT